MSTAYLVAGVRTPFGRYGGALAPVRPDDLAAHVLRELSGRLPSVDWDELDDVLLGCANQAGEDNRNVARMATLLAGLPVEVHVSGQARPLPAGVELAAYRVIQEALTNSLKHAGRATATVDIGYDAARLTVAVTDDGVGVPDGWETGHGLVGMRERVAVYGGEVTAGRRPNGGFAVRATLPVAGSQ